jgi:broad specificity phosphatase PhoE
MKFTVLRHATASKAEGKGYQADLARALSDDGVSLALARRMALDNPEFDLILASPATRTVQTASIVAGLDAGTTGKVLTLQQLCYPDPTKGDGIVFDALFNRIGYAPFMEYLGAEGGAALFEHWGTRAWSMAFGTAKKAGAANVLAVTHAVCANSFGYEGAERNPLFRRRLAEANFGECEGYVLTLDSAGYAIDLDLLVK